MTGDEIMRLGGAIYDMIEEFGPEAIGAIYDIKRTFETVERRSHCEQITNGVRCGEEGQAYVLQVEGERVFRCKCPIHGFRRTK